MANNSYHNLISDKNVKLVYELQENDILLFKSIDKTALEQRICIPHRNIVRMLLKAYAYNHQDKLLKEDWQIEHILPQKWQTTFFPDVEDKEVYEMIEHIGNKTPFEKKLNIEASNGYFKKKQDKYKESEIEVTSILVTSINSDWTLGNIKHRDQIISSELLKLIENWNLDYEKTDTHTEPTPEELALIEKFKKKGWVG